MTGSPAGQDERRERATEPGSSTPPGSAPDRRYEGYANPPPRSGPEEPPPPASQTPPPSPEGERAGSGARPPDGRSSSTAAFVDRLFGRRTPGGAPDDAGEDGEEPAPRSDTPSGRPPAGRQPPPLSERASALARELTGLNAGELEALAQADGPFARAVQSEIDRRTARANRERDEQGRFVRQQRLGTLRGQARQARQTDVYKAAELEEQADQLEQQEAFVRGLVEQYDRVSIDPIMQALPEADRASLLAAVPDGLEGRAELVRTALRTLERRWRADEARKVRGGGERRRENAERRQQRAEEDGEPDLVSGIGRGRNGRPTMNDWLRTQLSK